MSTRKVGTGAASAATLSNSAAIRRRDRSHHLHRRYSRRNRLLTQRGTRDERTPLGRDPSDGEEQTCLLLVVDSPFLERLRVASNTTTQQPSARGSARKPKTSARGFLWRGVPQQVYYKAELKAAKANGGDGWEVLNRKKAFLRHVAAVIAARILA
eukprot:scaffold8138_cov108-Isochrysis_galbana.AAC.1